MSELRVALTFDAEHPDRSRCEPGTQDAIVHTLSEAGVRATFFLQGRWVTAYPDLVRRIVAAGHPIGNHSDYHVRMPLLSDEGLREDIDVAGEKIRRIAGVDPRPWFRCPFGEGERDPRVLRAIEDAGYRNVSWDVDAEDWEDDTTAGEVEQLIVERTLAHGDGAVVLLHTWPAPTLDALPGIIERLRSARVAFVGVDDLASAAAAAAASARSETGAVDGR
ncbi:MAG TPA: polysaccharide deacetylase family protein [Actinomycetota bacterium]